MLAYLVRRLAFGLATVLGVLLFLFVLFFLLATPDDIARKAVGEKAPPEAIDAVEARTTATTSRASGTRTRPPTRMLVDHFRRMLTFDFGRSDADDTPIARAPARRRRPEPRASPCRCSSSASLLGIALALFVAFFRDTYIDRAGVVLCVLAMSVSILLYIIGGQYLLGKLLRWFPISGFDPAPGGDRCASSRCRSSSALLAGSAATCASTAPSSSRRRARDYVRTARAKGCGEGARHAPPRAAQRADPDPDAAWWCRSRSCSPARSCSSRSSAFPGSARSPSTPSTANDFATLRVMVYIGALLFIAGQIATDVRYTLVDPRVRLG